MKLRLLGWIPLAAASTCALVACNKDKKSGDAKPDAGPVVTAQATTAVSATAPATTAQVTPEQFTKRCEQLGRLCGDKDKHKEKIVEECKSASKDQTDKGCAQSVIAAYDCYETELCAKVNKVWSVSDFGVLTERHAKCMTEREAATRCLDGTAK